MINIYRKTIISYITLIVYILSIVIIYQIPSPAVATQTNLINASNIHKIAYIRISSDSDAAGLVDNVTSLMLSGKYNEANSVLDKALAISPNHIITIAFKGLVLAGLGKYEEAITVSDKALAIDSNNTMALDSKAIALYYLGRYSEANSVSDKALAIDSNDTEAVALKSKVAALNALKGTK
jgi:tetratricopeptide (TPR) repeat protein